MEDIGTKIADGITNGVNWVMDEVQQSHTLSMLAGGVIVVLLFYWIFISDDSPFGHDDY